MGLLANGFRDTSGVYQTFGATASNSAIPGGHHGQYHRTGAMRNLTAGEAITSDLVGLPSGYRHPGAWLMPQKAGALSSYKRAVISIASSGSAALGRGIDGTAAFSLSAIGLGGLIAGGVGTAILTVSGSGSVTATISSPGTATISFTSTANIGALGWLGGASVLSLDGALVPYARGHMVGTTEESGLTVAGITNSVWNALLSKYTEAGSAGNTLSLAGSGGVDYGALADAILNDPRALTLVKYLGLK